MYSSKPNISRLVTQTNVKLQCDRYTKEAMCEAERIREVGKVLTYALDTKDRQT